MIATYFLHEHKEMQKLIHTAGSGEKSNHSLLITHLVFGMLIKYESNLLAEHKWMCEFTQQQVERREMIHSYNHILC